MEEKEITLVDFEALKQQYEQDKNHCRELVAERNEKENLLKCWFRNWIENTDRCFYGYHWEKPNAPLPLSTPFPDLETIKDQVVPLSIRINKLEKINEENRNILKNWFQEWVKQVAHQLGGEEPFWEIVNRFEDELVWKTWTKHKYKRTSQRYRYPDELFWGYSVITIQTYKRTGDTIVTYTLTELCDYIIPITTGGNRDLNFEMIFG